MNILQPLLLDRSCLVNKMKKLSPLIDQLEWINTNDRAFRAYWSFYANGCKQRQQDIRQRIEQNADFVKNIKSKKAASFLKILTQDKAPIKVTQMEASDTIYQEFLECFRRPRKRDKNSQFWWQREFDDALKRLNRTRNPYDMVQIIEKLKKIKQLQSLKRQPTPYADRFQKPRIKYESESHNKLKEVPEIQSKAKVEIMKRQHKGKFLRKRSEIHAPRIHYAKEKHLENEIPEISAQEIKPTEVKADTEEASEEPQQEEEFSNMEYSHRSEDNLKPKSHTYIRTDAPSDESTHNEDEHPQRKRYQMLRDLLKKRHDSPLHKPNELVKKHRVLTYNRSSTHIHIPHNKPRYRSIARKSLLKDDSNDDFNLWYSDFAKHKAQYTKSRLKPRKHSSVMQTQLSLNNIKAKHHHKKHHQKSEEARYNPINALETIQQFQKNNPKLMAFLKKYDDEAKPRKILEPDLKPYEPNIERFTIDEVSGQVMHAHKHQKSTRSTVGPQRGSVKSKTGSVSERADDLSKRVVVKERATAQVQTSAEGTSTYGSDRISVVSGSGSNQIRIRKTSKWELELKQSNKSIGTLKSPESQEAGPEMPEDRLFGYKMRFLDREVVYKNPYKEQNFINRISNAFQLASMGIRSNVWHKNSLMSKLSTIDVKTQTALRKEISKLDTRLSNQFHLPRRRSTYQRIPEPKPLIIADLIADFVKSRSIEKIFKDMHPAMFNPPPQETKKPKQPKPIKINQPKGPTKKRKRLTAKPQLKPKACISCSICQQLQKHPSNALHPYMLQMQSQLKRNELRAYYKQMMLRNCQLARELQAQRHPKQHFCHVSVMS